MARQNARTPATRAGKRHLYSSDSFARVEPDACARGYPQCQPRLGKREMTGTEARRSVNCANLMGKTDSPTQTEGQHTGRRRRLPPL